MCVIQGINFSGRKLILFVEVNCILRTTPNKQESHVKKYYDIVSKLTNLYIAALVQLLGIFFMEVFIHHLYHKSIIEEHLCSSIGPYKS